MWQLFLSAITYFSFCLIGKEMRKKHEDEYMQAVLGISIFYFLPFYDCYQISAFVFLNFFNKSIKITRRTVNKNICWSKKVFNRRGEHIIPVDIWFENCLIMTWCLCVLIIFSFFFTKPLWSQVWNPSNLNSLEKNRWRRTSLQSSSFISTMMRVFLFYFCPWTN